MSDDTGQMHCGLPRQLGYDYETIMGSYCAVMLDDTGQWRSRLLASVAVFIN